MTEPTKITADAKPCLGDIKITKCENCGKRKLCAYEYDIFELEINNRKIAGWTCLACDSLRAEEV